MFEEWDSAMQGLRHAIETSTCDDPYEILKPVRVLNRRFLVLAAARLHHLVSNFPVPGSAAIPAAPAGPLGTAEGAPRRARP